MKPNICTLLISNLMASTLDACNGHSFFFTREASQQVRILGLTIVGLIQGVSKYGQAKIPRILGMGIYMKLPPL